MPFGGALILGAVSAAPKLYAAYQQNKRANELRVQNTTPAAFLEKAALDRQAAASGVMPGQAAAQTRLAGVQAGALQAGRMGAASSGDFLAAAGAADARRQAGEQQLSTQAAQYGIQAQHTVGADLTQQAAYQKNDLDTYNRTKAALTQGSAENLNNAVEGAAGYAAYGMNNAANAAAGVGAGAPGVGYNNPANTYAPNGATYTPGIPSGLGRPRYRTPNYGVPY